MLKVIPAIDIKNNSVVCASQSNREKYKPIKSILVKGSKPEDIVSALLKTYAFNTFYIADLDSIISKNINLSIVRQLCERFPLIKFWVDYGITSTEDFGHSKSIKNITPVVGTETLENADVLVGRNKSEYLLSLDFNDKKLLGPNSILSQVELFPDKVIAMCLHRIGGQRGPDYSLLKKICRKLMKSQVIASGGVRNLEDLSKLEKIGINHVIVSTVLHNGLFIDNL